MLILNERCAVIGSNRDDASIFRLSGRQPLAAFVLNEGHALDTPLMESFLKESRSTMFETVKECSDELSIHLETTGAPFRDDTEVIVTGIGSMEEYPSYERFRVRRDSSSVEPLPGDSITYRNRGIFTSFSEPDILNEFIAGIDRNVQETVRESVNNLLQQSARRVLDVRYDSDIIRPGMAASMVRRPAYDSYSTVHSLLRMSEPERMEFVRTAMRVVSLAEGGDPGNSRIAMLSKDHGFVWID